jgi:ABC-type Fe3+ transport system permease subunit
VAGRKLVDCAGGVCAHCLAGLAGAGADWAHWQDLLRYVLPDAAANTAWLLGGVGLVVLVVGTAAPGW